MLNLVTDRTYADYLKWKELHDKGWEAMTQAERSLWLSGMKGAYNHTDMNRVESAVRTLEARFEKMGINLSLTTRTNWARTSWPTVSDMDRYFGNVEKVRAAMGANLPTPPAPTTATRFDYQKANDLEEILSVVDWWLDRIEASSVYSGDIYLGEV